MRSPPGASAMQLAVHVTEYPRDHADGLADVTGANRPIPPPTALGSRHLKYGSQIDAGPDLDARTWPVAAS